MQLYVSLNGLVVGQLEKLKNGGLQFTYSATWLASDGNRPISLSLPLAALPYTGDKVYNFFDNLLPDNTQIRQKIQTRFNVGSSHAFDLLAAVGNDCVGAIQLSTDLPGDPKAINYKKDGTPFIMYWRVLPIKNGKNIEAWVAIQREGAFI